MARLYYNLITNPKAGWTIDMVPEKWRAEVEALLNKNVTK